MTSLLNKVKVTSKVIVKLIPDLDPSLSYLDQEGFEDRKAAFMKDEFIFVGVKVFVEFSSSLGSSKTYESAGLWGIESDSKDEYILDIAYSELADLKFEYPELQDLELDGEILRL